MELVSKGQGTEVENQRDHTIDVTVMNYIAYRCKLYKLDLQRKLSEKSILKDIAEARDTGNEETLEKLYAVLNAHKTNYDRNRYKLFTKYFCLQY